MNRFLEPTFLVLLALLATPGCSRVAPWLGSDVHFQSSDGEWSDAEVLSKGRAFDDVVVLFHLFRHKCQSQATLQRTTSPPPWYKPEGWFNDYSESKWRVPLAKPIPDLPPHYPPVSAQHCANRGSTDAEYSAAEQQAERYVLRLPPAL